MILRNEPWLTQTAILFLENLLKKNPNLKILEFGSGASTVWFAKRTKFLISVEHSKEWYEFVKINLQNCSECYPVEQHLIENDYYKVCQNYPDEYFDLILIDGKNRVKCTKESMRILKKGGILMLDNAERPWYEPIYELLKDWPKTISIQEKPDNYGSFYPNWQTVWWIKN